MDIYAMIVIVILATMSLHYFPWRPLLGRELPRPAAFILATLVVMLPTSAILLLWNHEPPRYIAHITIAIILAVVWGSILAAGVTDLVLTGLDNFLETRARMLAAEDDRRLTRERMDHDGTSTGSS